MKDYPFSAFYNKELFDNVMRTFRIDWFLANEPAQSVDQIVHRAIARTRNQILKTKFVPWKFYPRNETFEPASKMQGSLIHRVDILENSKSEAHATLRDYIHEDESYRIEIGDSGGARILTSSSIGTIRALQTFQQLFYAHSSGLGAYTPYAPISITDNPRWSYRGLNLDISRNAYGPRHVKQTIEAMSTAKLNRLHIHATDSQSWPLDIPSMPALAAKGAYHKSQVWTQSDLKDVQLYGLERGVSVYVEIDLPGHTASIAHAYPELIAAFEEKERETYALEPPSGQIKLNSSAVYEFLDNVLDDLLPRVSPFTRYFHTGGDEMNLNTYLIDETIKSNDKSVIKPLLQTMVGHVHDKIRKAGLTPIAWEELVLDWNLTLSSSSGETTNPDQKDVYIEAWRDSTAVRKLLENGYRTIFGSGDAWYLDCGYGNFFNPKQNSTKVKDPFTDWCSPFKNWRHIYVYDPLDGIPQELWHLLEGGEAHLWSENADPIVMDGMIWPRAAAAAEVLWSGPRKTEQIQDASYRLGAWRERAVLDHGIRAGVVQMTYCLMREGSCEA